ncbi:MAG: class I SAM-dependent methyltransferase [Acidimicrobiia bacterium]|nr:class I SAM-dependent methyltransferase [Acidimicrobiia bacterium]
MSITSAPITAAEPVDRGVLDPVATEESIEIFADKVFNDLVGALNTYATTIGVTLGWYEALASGAPMTAGELATATDTDERYAREWLEQQTVSGYLTVVDASAPPADRRFSIEAEAAEIMTDRSSLAYMAPFPGLASSLGRSLPKVIEAYRSGDGFGWHEHDGGARCGQAEANRPMFLNVLGQEYLASVPSVRDALNDGGTVADVGCGLGWSSIGIALAYPTARVDGYDVDGPSIEQARINATEAGVADRVQFHIVDAADVQPAPYDLVLALECVHDMSDPVSVLASMKRMTKPTGSVIVMDERVGETFTGEPDPLESFMYCFSLICCLPDGRNAAESVATGTVMRPATLEQYAKDAGFSALEILDIENDFFRFYNLVL